MRTAALSKYGLAHDQRGSRPLVVMALDWEPAARHGGSEVVAVNLARQFSADGYRVVLLAGTPAADRQGWHSFDEGIDLYCYWTPSDRTLFQMAYYALVYPRKVRAVMRRLKYDCLILHHALSGRAFAAAVPVNWSRTAVMYYGAVDQEWLAERSGRFSVLSRGYERFVAKRLRSQQRWLLQSRANVVALSRASATEAMERADVCHGRLSVFAPGVDTARFKPGDQLAARRRLGLPEDCLVLLCVRRLVRRMGVERLLDAVAAVRQRGMPVQLVIGGKGAQSHELRRYASARQLDGVVTWAGFIPEDKLADYYRAADLFVLPSSCQEGFGLVTIEALASGTPVVGTPLGATRELLDPIDARLVAADLRTESLARAIESVLRCPRDEWDLLREKCVARARSRYAWVDMAQGIQRACGGG